MNNRHSKKVGRNELCPCGSGKKYKKCCLLNDQKNMIVNDVISELEYKITDEPVNDNDIRKLLEEVQNKLDDLYDELHINPKNCIEDLEILIERYSHIPQFYNYLYVAYAQIGEITKANNIMKENYKKNPTYLFALLNYSEYLINNGDFTKVSEVLNNKFDLNLLYPDRDTFHTTEVVNFHGVVGLYFFLAGKTEKALKCLKILKALSPMDAHTKRLNEHLRRNKMLIA